MSLEAHMQAILLQAALEHLRYLNTHLGDEIKCFWVDSGADIYDGGYFKLNVIIVLPPPEADPGNDSEIPPRWPMETIDKYCNAVKKELDGIHLFNHYYVIDCWFRTQDEYDEQVQRFRRANTIFYVEQEKQEEKAE